MNHYPIFPTIWELYLLVAFGVGVSITPSRIISGFTKQFNIEDTSVQDSLFFQLFYRLTDPVPHQVYGTICGGHFHESQPVSVTTHIWNSLLLSFIHILEILHKLTATSHKWNLASAEKSTTAQTCYSPSGGT